MIGSGLALVTIFSTVPYWLIWIVVFLIFDIDLYIKMIMVRNGFLKYELDTHE
jgi:hypothetical protein